MITIIITTSLIGLALYVGVLYGKRIIIWVNQLFKRSPNRIKKEDITEPSPYDELRRSAQNGSVAAREALKDRSIFESYSSGRKYKK